MCPKPNVTNLLNRLYLCVSLAVIFFAVGVVDMYFHWAFWNRPIHWTSVAVLYVTFPVLIFGFVVRANNYWYAATYSAIIILGYFSGAEVGWYSRHRRWWDDLLIVFPIGVGCFLASLLLAELRRRWKRRPPPSEHEQYDVDDDPNNPYRSPTSR